MDNWLKRENRRLEKENERLRSLLFSTKKDKTPQFSSYYFDRWKESKKELIEELCEYVFLNYSRQKVGTCEDGTPYTTNILDGKPREFNLYLNIEEIVNTYLTEKRKRRGK
tara:strand:+ start:491 stop:823 length:333 start_codon:yes stop_codon:yes gene_type:complete